MSNLWNTTPVITSIHEQSLLYVSDYNFTLIVILLTQKNCRKH